MSPSPQAQGECDPSPYVKDCVALGHTEVCPTAEDGKLSHNALAREEDSGKSSGPPELTAQEIGEVFRKASNSSFGGRGKAPLVCQVVNCNADLSGLKPYYQRHRICLLHFKITSMEVDGDLSRFCNQCGAFQPLSAFDGNLRTCRFRLARHNSRRKLSKYKQSLGKQAKGSDNMLSDDSFPLWREAAMHLPVGLNMPNPAAGGPLMSSCSMPEEFIRGDFDSSADKLETGVGWPEPLAGTSSVPFADSGLNHFGFKDADQYFEAAEEQQYDDQQQCDDPQPRGMGICYKSEDGGDPGEGPTQNHFKMEGITSRWRGSLQDGGTYSESLQDGGTYSESLQDGGAYSGEGPTQNHFKHPNPNFPATELLYVPKARAAHPLRRYLEECHGSQGQGHMSTSSEAAEHTNAPNSNRPHVSAHVQDQSYRPPSLACLPHDRSSEPLLYHHKHHNTHGALQGGTGRPFYQQGGYDMYHSAPSSAARQHMQYQGAGMEAGRHSRGNRIDTAARHGYDSHAPQRVVDFAQPCSHGGQPTGDHHSNDYYTMENQIHKPMNVVPRTGEWDDMEEDIFQNPSTQCQGSYTVHPVARHASHSVSERVTEKQLQAEILRQLGNFPP